jgi:4-hydroxy-3-methylbut-2-enyl diphosphate reductase IspH
VSPADDGVDEDDDGDDAKCFSVRDTVPAEFCSKDTTTREIIVTIIKMLGNRVMKLAAKAAEEIKYATTANAIAMTNAKGVFTDIMVIHHFVLIVMGNF